MHIRKRQLSYLHKILVPVDFGVNTKVALNKAVDFAVPGVTEIMLLHIKQSKAFLGSDLFLPRKITSHVDIQLALHRVQDEITAHNPFIETATNIINANKVEEALIDFANTWQPGLIIIGKNNHHCFFPFLNTVLSANIAEQTKCPVLTVKPGSLQKKLTTVVLPVGDFYPKRKIEMLSALSTKAPLNVHLVSVLKVNQQPDSHSASIILQVLKQLRNKFNCTVQCSIVHADNKAIATLRYAEKVKADMLLVNPEVETSISTWMSRKDIADVLKPVSQLQVMSIKPDLQL